MGETVSSLTSSFYSCGPANGATDDNTVIINDSSLCLENKSVNLIEQECSTDVYMGKFRFVSLTKLLL